MTSRCSIAIPRRINTPHAPHLPRYVTSAKQGIPPPHPSHVRPQGIQEEADEYKEEQSHVRSLSDECTSKPTMPKASATTRVSKKAAPVEEGTLSNQSVIKLDSTLKRMREALDTMLTQLESAGKSTYIAPMLISKLMAVTNGLTAEIDLLKLYRSNNKEADTATVIEQAKQKLNSSLKEFAILKKLLKAEEVIIGTAANVPGSLPCVD